MGQFGHTILDSQSSHAESGAIDAVIRPCLREAFPLPEADHPNEERFRLLLNALAQRGREAR